MLADSSVSIPMLEKEAHKIDAGEAAWDDRLAETLLEALGR